MLDLVTRESGRSSLVIEASNSASALPPDEHDYSTAQEAVGVRDEMTNMDGIWMCQEPLTPLEVDEHTMENTEAAIAVLWGAQTTKGVISHEG